VEIEADYQGYAHAQATLYWTLKGRARANHRYSDNNIALDQGAEDPFLAWYFSEIGMLSFFFSIELLERTVRTLLHGNDGRNDPLYTQDFDIQDMVLRDTHPSPATRRDFVCKVMKSSAGNQKDAITPMVTSHIEGMLRATWEEVYPRIRRAHASGLRPHRKWTDPSTEMSCASL